LNSDFFMSKPKTKGDLMHVPTTMLEHSFAEKPRRRWLWAAIARAFAKVSAYVAGYREANAAAALYHALSRLSDAELARRGIDRAELHRLVEQATRPADGGRSKPDAKR
jgi:hypothetical protein